VARNPLIPDTSYTVGFNLEGASILTWGQSPEPTIQRGFWSPGYAEVDVIREVASFTPEGIDTLDLACSTAGRDPRRADFGYLEDPHTSMARFEKSPQTLG
jgi:hypothetical protein